MKASLILKMQKMLEEIKSIISELRSVQSDLSLGDAMKQEIKYLAMMVDNIGQIILYHVNTLTVSGKKSISTQRDRGLANDDSDRIQEALQNSWACIEHIQQWAPKDMNESVQSTMRDIEKAIVIIRGEK